MSHAPAHRASFAALLLALGACTYDDYGYGYGSSGDGYRYPAYSGGYYGPAGVGGTGANDLDPWLRSSAAGQRLVLARFDRNRNGEIGEDRAAEANAWFRRFADRNRDMELTDGEIERGLRRLGGALR